MMNASRRRAPLLLSAVTLCWGLACGPADGRENNTFETLGESSTETGACAVGSEGCACTPGGFCDGALVCVEGLCAAPAGDGDGDPTTTSGDGDGDPTTTSGDGDGDGDGDPTTTGDPTTGGAVCDQTHMIEILAVDADEISGWTPTMSMLGEGMVLAWDQGNPDAYVQFSLGIPCEDFWHIWVRGHDNAAADSYFVAIDGMPDPNPVFEIDCTPQGNGEYKWRELNYREVDAGPCETTIDPWVQDWKEGFHALRLTYRESIALSKIYLTNTETPPP